MSLIKNICCIGAGFVGGPTMAVIADRCKSVKVTVVDINAARINAWNDSDLSKLPIYEPGLDLVIKRARGKNLFFSLDVEHAISSADMVFISVNTPTKTKGLGAGKASDLRWVEACARQVANYAKGHTIVVEKSTLPVRTAEVIQTILDAAQSSPQNQQDSCSFNVLSNPEFLAEGTAVKDLEDPDRVLIGGDDAEAIEALASIYKNWVPEERILRTNIWSSELAKLTANAFLAQRISSINSIGALCEATGADIREVSRAIGTDSRIGSKFLEAGPGFGGSCFKKDILNLVYLSRYFGLPEVADFWEGVVKLNTWHQQRISSLIVKKLFGTLSNKKVAILGFAFKANTNDTRESSAIQIAKDLLDEGAQLSIHDPKVDPVQIEKDLCLSARKINQLEINSESNEGSWFFSNDVSDACRYADAILILTEWHQYSLIDWKQVAIEMRNPAWVFDARSIVDSEKVVEAGLNFWRVGDGS